MGLRGVIHTKILNLVLYGATSNFTKRPWKFLNKKGPCVSKHEAHCYDQNNCGSHFIYNKGSVAFIDC